MVSRRAAATALWTAVLASALVPSVGAQCLQLSGLKPVLPTTPPGYTIGDDWVAFSKLACKFQGYGHVGLYMSSPLDVTPFCLTRDFEQFDVKTSPSPSTACGPCAAPYNGYTCGNTVLASADLHVVVNVYLVANTTTLSGVGVPRPLSSTFLTTSSTAGANATVSVGLDGVSPSNSSSAPSTATILAIVLPLLAILVIALILWFVISRRKRRWAVMKSGDAESVSALTAGGAGLDDKGAYSEGEVSVLSSLPCAAAFEGAAVSKGLIAGAPATVASGAEAEVEAQELQQNFAAQQPALSQEQEAFRREWEAYAAAYYASMGVQPPPNMASDLEHMMNHRESFMQWRAAPSPQIGKPASVEPAALARMMTVNSVALSDEERTVEPVV